MADPFFIVVARTGAEHPTHAAAFAAAHRMAVQNPGKTYHVMRSASRPVREEMACD